MSQLSIYIDEKLASSSHTVSIEPYIFRVDELLHKENKRAYEPELLAIGPYHRNKDHLKLMEGHKLRYTQEFLKRRNESSVGRYVEAIEELEEKARNCYANPVELDRDQFVEMMLFDGIFIMELLRNFRFLESRENDTLQSDRIQEILVRDILLFENQLPLFVLIRLSGMANEPDFSVEYAFWTYIRERTRFMVPDVFISPPPEVDLHHLLGFMRYAMRPSFLDDLGAVPSFYSEDPSFYSDFPRCATALEDSGIKFKRGRVFERRMDIEFKDGVMKMQPFIIRDDTELLFRNLIAYEQYNHENEWTYVTSYVKFMNCLIQSPNDVKILCQRRILGIGEGMDAESAFTMFNKLRGIVFMPKHRFCYNKICWEIEKHCKRPWNLRMAKWRHREGIWMAKLKQDYFNSPWSVLLFIAAFVLLILTAVQTVCSISQV